MIIDFNYATILLNKSSLKLNATCTLTNYINTIDKALYNIDDMGNGFKWVRINNLDYNGMKANVNACFHGDVLTRIDISIDVYEENKSWKLWDYEKELEAKRIHDKLLKNNISVDFLKYNEKKSQFECKYFTIQSIFDSKSGSSYITITYSNEIIGCINNIFIDLPYPWILQDTYNEVNKKYGTFISKLLKDIYLDFQAYDVDWKDKVLSQAVVDFNKYIAENYSFFNNKTKNKIVSIITYLWM